MITQVNGTVDIDFGLERLTLLPQRAVWWSATQTVMVADVHLGKAATFRAAGVPVPSGSTARDLVRMSELIELTGAARLIILGDLFHARLGRSPEVHDAISQWRERHAAVETILVRGNHDRSAGRVLAEWNIREEDDCFQEGSLQLVHHAKCKSKLPSVCGHVHPVIHLQDYDRSLVRVPCFVADPLTLMLPAFGTFTGGGAISPQDDRQIYIVTEKRIVRVAKKLCR